MPTEALKSTPITNADASPPVFSNPGMGARARVMEADGWLTATTAMDTGSTYRLARVPSNAIVKHVLAHLDAAVVTFTGDIGLYYAQALDGTAGAVIDADFFASAVALAAIVTPTDYTRESGVYTGVKSQKELWDAAGLTSDPGGYFDVVITLTATSSGGAVPFLEVEYVMPGA